MTVVGECALNACDVNARAPRKLGAPRESGTEEVKSFTALQVAFDKKNKKTARKLIELGAEDGLFEAVKDKRYKEKAFMQGYRMFSFGLASVIFNVNGATLILKHSRK